MFYGINPLYIMMMLPIFIFSMIAQAKVKSSFQKYSQLGVKSGMTGAQVAKMILQKAGVNDVIIEETSGWLSDHYSPTQKRLRLSQRVYRSSSIAAVGVAAHEAGHALQHYQGMLIMRFWMTLAKPAAFMSNGAIFLILIGLMIHFLQPLAMVGLVFFLVVVVFQLVTLPVEFNASSRAKNLLYEHGIVTYDELQGVSTVLSSAAMTYVAAAAAALTQLLYFAMLLGRRR